MHALTVFYRRVVCVLAATGLAVQLSAEDVSTGTAPSPQPEGEIAASQNGGNEPELPVRALTLDEALRIAVENNLALASGTFERLIARESIRIADAAYQPVFTAEVARQFRQRETTSDIEASESDTTAGSLTISQRLNTGAVVSLSGGTSRNESTLSFDPLFYDADASIFVRQPLLRGAGFTANRIERRQAAIGADRSDLTYTGRVLDIIQLTEVAFYNIAFAQENLDVQQSGVDAAERFVRENEARQRAGLATQLDVMQSRVGLANRRAALIQARQLLRDTTDELLALLGDTAFQGLIEPVDVDFGLSERLSVGRSYGLARANDTEILAAEALLEQLELEARLAANERLPQVDLGAGYGLDNVDLDGHGRAIRELPDRDGFNWQVSLSATVPWGLTEGRARLRQAEFQLLQQRAFLAELEQDLMLRVRAAVRAVETDTESVEIANLATQLSAQEYQLEKARFDSGLSTSRLVVDAQQRENIARVSETEARVRLKQNEAQLRRIQGTSLEQFSIAVPPVQ